MDVDTIALGRDFRQVVRERLESCDLMLALVGRNWVDAKNPSGQRRLEDANDFVRLEIEAALKRNIPVTPVFVQGAQMPTVAQLPKEIEAFAYRNGFELSHNLWNSDVQEMIKRLGLSKQRDRKPWPKIVGVSVVAIALLGGGVFYYRTEKAKEAAAQLERERVERERAAAAKEEKERASAQAERERAAAAQAEKDRAARGVNYIRNFRAKNVSNTELRVTVDFTYDGQFGTSVYIYAAPVESGGGIDPRTFDSTKVPLRLGDNTVTLKVTKSPESRDFTSVMIRACVSTPEKVIVCENFPHTKSWSTVARPARPKTPSSGSTPSR